MMTISDDNDSEVVDIKSLQVPKSSLTEIDLDSLKGSTVRQWAKSPFPVDEDINQRVLLYDGDLELLKAEAIVNPTNENLSNLSYVSRLAGPQLEQFVRQKVRLCATGEVRVTPGFESNFKYIIHAVPPKYQPKFKTAAETALFHTYFRILETMIERRIRSIIMPTLVTSKSNLPLEDNCNLQLRIIRRLLEKKRNEFDRIVIHVDQATNKDLYLQSFHCYFPRTQLDEEIACYQLCDSLGGINGEPVIPERKIRIKSKPAVLAVNHASENSVDLTSGLDLSTVVGKTAFSRMHDFSDNPASSSTGGTLAVATRRPSLRRCSIF